MPNGNGSPKRTRLKRRVDIVIKAPALSTNKLYSGKKRRSYYYKAFRKKVFGILKEELRDNYKLNGNLAFEISVGFSSSLSDLSNAIKGIEDVLTEYLKFNDRQIVDIRMKKWLVNKGDEFMDITIRKVNRNIDLRRKT